LSAWLMQNCAVRRFMDAYAAAKDKKLAQFTVAQRRNNYLQSKGYSVSKYRCSKFTSRERLRFLADKEIPFAAYS